MTHSKALAAEPCCVESSSPGCEDPTVEACTCAIDEFCCTSAWDDVCVNQAAAKCGLECTVPKAECCITDNDAVGCQDPAIEACVCAQFPGCCSNQWSPVCPKIAREQCGANCQKGECCIGNHGVGCDTPEVEGCVCASDPYCCTTEWDESCASKAHACGCGGTETCCAAHTSEGCNDPNVQACVCEDLPECCNGPWAEACAAKATTCGASCPTLEGCCSPHGSASCNDDVTSACVCEKNASCCTGSWTSTCVELATGCGGCEPPKAEACQPSKSARGTTDPTIEACVCSKRTSCCTTRWDAACVLLADACGASCEPVGEGPCCGGKDGPGCEHLSVEACVCDAEPACCSSIWSASCGLYAQAKCGLECAKTPCCVTDARTGGCAVDDVTSCVCKADPYCCTGSWTEACVALAGTCGAGCDGAPVPKGPCDVVHSSSGCEQASIEGCVCDARPACCTGPWAEDCVDLALACQPDVCGDGVCTPDESCGACAADCACSALDQCVEGVCIPRELYFFGETIEPVGWGLLNELTFGCGAPTAQRCTDPAYLDRPCGRALLAEARRDPHHVCHGFAATSGDAAISGLNQTGTSTLTLKPTLVRRVGPPVTPPRPLTPATALVDDGGDAPRFIRDTPWSQVPPGSEELFKGLTGINGSRIASCVEYLYEKHYDYHLFEDQAAQLGDSRAVFELAFGPAATRSSIGTRTIAGTGLRDRAGAPSRLVPIGRVAPKNPFFEIPAPLFIALAARPDLNPSAPFANLQLGVTLPPGWAAWARLRAGMQQTTAHGFAWHLAQSQAMATLGKTDAELYAFEPFKERFRQLVSAANYAVQRADFLRQVRPDLPDLPPGMGPELAPSVPDGAPTEAEIAQAVAHADRLVDRVVDALVDAADLGCLDAAPSPCDWSPEEFVRDLVSAGLPGREADLTRCYDATASVSFASLANYAFPALGATSYPTKDYLASPSAIDLLVPERSSWVRDVVAYVGELGLAAVDGIPRVGQVLDVLRDSLPDRWFGFDTGFHFDWDIVDLQEDDPLEPHSDLRARADFEANGVVLDRVIPLADFALRFNGTTGNRRSRIDISLLGAEIYEDAFRVNIPYRWNLVRTRYADDAEVRFDGPIFPIAGIPVRLSGGIGGSVALDVDVDAAAPVVDVRAYLRALFRPEIEVYGFLEAAVDYTIIRAGVRGELVLIGASLPVTLEAQIGLEPASGNIVASAAAQGSIDLRTLDGRFKLFAELDLGITSERVEKRIASWRGIHSQATLFATDFDVPIVGLIEACAIPGALECETSDE